MSKDSLDRHLARIVGNTRRKKRVVSIPDLATSIDKAARMVGGIGSLSDRVMLSETMLRQFLSVKDLHPNVRELFDKRDLDSVDLCAQLATLDPEDQIALAKEAVCGSLRTKDIRDFRELRKRNKTLSTTEIIRKVLESKPRVEFLAEFVLRSGDAAEQVDARLRKHLKAGDILQMHIDGSIVSLVLSKAGRDRMLELSRKSGFNLEQTIQMVASSKL
tara:strand:- start:622 stop:1275 length:654 start_codon:yes stop_codon:yes gene_type:complete